MELKDILSKCDHTLLAQTATWDEIKAICDDGMKYGCASVCIPASDAKQAAGVCGGEVPHLHRHRLPQRLRHHCGQRSVRWISTLGCKDYCIRKLVQMRSSRKLLIMKNFRIAVCRINQTIHISSCSSRCGRILKFFIISNFLLDLICTSFRIHNLCSQSRIHRTDLWPQWCRSRWGSR